MTRLARDPVVVIEQPIPWRAARTEKQREALVESHVGTMRQLRAGDWKGANVRVLALTFKRRLRVLPPTEVGIVVEVVSAPVEIRRAVGLGG